jgi:hypothetical protein
MDYHTKKYVEILSKAIPASGYYPAKEVEWVRLQRAMVDASYHMYRANGVPKAQAKCLAHLIHGGLAGRLLLDAVFNEPEDGEVVK